MNTNYLIGIVAVILLGSGAYFLMAPTQTAPVMNETTGAPATPTSATTTGAAPTTENGILVDVDVNLGTPITVTYTDQGFSPSTVTIKKGQSVTFVNKSSKPMWVGADEHPSHTGYDGTSRTTHCASDYAGPASFDQCGAGSSYTFTFNELGTWPYHNHASAQNEGTVVVTQ